MYYSEIVWILLSNKVSSSSYTPLTHVRHMFLQPTRTGRLDDVIERLVIHVVGHHQVEQVADGRAQQEVPSVNSKHELTLWSFNN